MKGIEVALKRAEQLSEEESRTLETFLSIKNAIPTSIKAWDESKCYIGFISPWAEKELRSRKIELWNFLNAQQEEICVCWYKDIGILLC